MASAGAGRRASDPDDAEPPARGAGDAEPFAPRNPTARNEGFTCIACGADVPPTRHGKPRNHCPFCLVSLHVDVVPGDRRESCRGVMDPQRYEVVSGGELVIVHRCRACGVERRVRAVVPPEPFPDRWEILS